MWGANYACVWCRVQILALPICQNALINLHTDIGGRCVPCVDVSGDVTVWRCHNLVMSRSGDVTVWRCHVLRTASFPGARQHHDVRMSLPALSIRGTAHVQSCGSLPLLNVSFRSSLSLSKVSFSKVCHPCDRCCSLVGPRGALPKYCHQSSWNVIMAGFLAVHPYNHCLEHIQQVHPLLAMSP